jgi:photosystem II stability/assembly factor-like uncharacterized protein
MKKKHLLQIVILLFTLLSVSFLKAESIVQLQQGKPTSIRGLSVVDDSVAWVSGSKGTIALTRDGGKTWNWQQLKGFEKSDFRDIEAFSDKEAIIMSSGTPALILKTTDGGTNWQVKYRNTDTAYFFDAMDFVGKKYGYVLGDPINNKFVLMETLDGGETWKMFKNRPVAIHGEGAFAASGTCLRVNKASVNVVSGGSAARLLTYSIDKNLWRYIKLPLAQGKPSQGAFSLAMGENNGVLTGGDYADDKRADSVSVNYKGQHPANFVSPNTGPAGFQSCVEFINGDTFLSTGTPGTNITADGGKTWTKIDDASYNVCRKAKHGKLVLLAGGGGKIGMLKL